MPLHDDRDSSDRALREVAVQLQVDLKDSTDQGMLHGVVVKAGQQDLQGVLSQGVMSFDLSDALSGLADTDTVTIGAPEYEPIELMVGSIRSDAADIATPQVRSVTLLRPRGVATPPLIPTRANPAAVASGRHRVADKPSPGVFRTSEVGTRYALHFLAPDRPLTLAESLATGTLQRFETYWEPLGWALEEWVSTDVLTPGEDAVVSDMIGASTASSPGGVDVRGWWCTARWYCGVQGNLVLLAALVGVVGHAGDGPHGT